MAIMSVCARTGCRNLVEDGGLCSQCAAKRKPNPSGRKSVSVKGWMNSARYRNRRREWIKGKLCVFCLEKGIRKFADTLEHKIAHCGDYELFWNEENWQGSCWSCHSRKTAKEDGGFGNPKGVK